MITSPDIREVATAAEEQRSRNNTLRLRGLLLQRISMLLTYVFLIVAAFIILVPFLWLASTCRRVAMGVSNRVRFHRDRPGSSRSDNDPENGRPS